MSLGVSNHGPNPNRQYAFFSRIRVKVVIPLEIQMQSLRVALATKMTKEDNDQLRLQEIEALD